MFPYDMGTNRYLNGYVECLVLTRKAWPAIAAHSLGVGRSSERNCEEVNDKRGGLGRTDALNSRTKCTHSEEYIIHSEWLQQRLYFLPLHWLKTLGGLSPQRGGQPRPITRVSCVYQPSSNTAHKRTDPASPPAAWQRERHMLRRRVGAFQS